MSLLDDDNGMCNASEPLDDGNVSLDAPLVVVVIVAVVVVVVAVGADADADPDDVAAAATAAAAVLTVISPDTCCS